MRASLVERTLIGWLAFMVGLAATSTYIQPNDASCASGSTGFFCERGHSGPYCTVSSLGVTREGGGTIRLHHPSQRDALTTNDARNVHARWAVEPTTTNWVCSEDSPTAYFIHLPYSPLIGGRINYYQFHVDVLLPLIAAYADAAKAADDAQVSKAPSAAWGAGPFLFPAVSKDWLAGTEAGMAIDFTTGAFGDPKAFWVDTLEAISDYPLAPLAPYDGVSELPGCFRSARFGLPSLEHPTPHTVVTSVGILRERLGLSGEMPLPCSAPDEITFVRRSNRRAILNEEELASAVSSSLGATVKWVDFGSGFRRDLESLRMTRVLVGGQGSGLINGWYLPPGNSDLWVGKLLHAPRREKCLLRPHLVVRH